MKESILNKTAQDLTVGEGLKITAGITLVSTAIALLPFVPWSDLKKKFKKETTDPWSEPFEA